MVKILQINSSAGPGGGETVVADLVRGLKDRFDLVVAAPNGQLKSDVEKEKILYVTLDSSSSFLKRVREVKKIIAEVGPTLIHCHGTRAAFWTRIAILFSISKPKLVYTLHGFHIARRNSAIKYFALVAERFLNSLVDALVVVSESDKELVLRYNIVSANKILVINNGVDINKFANISDNGLRQELGLSDKFVVSMIARLHPPKDYITVLKAIKILSFKIPEIFFLIVSDGPLRLQIEQFIKENKLDKFVSMLGDRRDVGAILKLSNLTILSSRWEGFPVVPLEAGACKRAVIGSDVSGIREVVKDRVNGLLFKLGDENDLAEKIEDLYYHPEKLADLGEEGYLLVSENFTVEKMIEKYHSLYLKLL